MTLRNSNSHTNIHGKRLRYYPAAVSYFMTPWNCYCSPTAWAIAPVRRNVIIMCSCQLRPASVSLRYRFRSSHSSGKRNNNNHWNDVGKYHNFYSHIYVASKLNTNSLVVAPIIVVIVTVQTGRSHRFRWPSANLKFCAGCPKSCDSSP